MAKFTIKGDDTVWEFDENELFVDEARIVKKHAAMGVNEFGRGLQTGDPDALVAMLWITKRRAGIEVQWKDFDHFNLATIAMVDETPDITDGDDPDDDAVPPTGEEAAPARSSGSRGGTTPKSVSSAT